MQNLHSLANISALGTTTSMDKAVRARNFISNLPNLSVYYPLNETSGNAINNAPSTLGTLDGTVVGATQGVVGQVGNAYSFGGDGDRVVVSGFVPTTAFSFFVAFKRNGAPDANDRIIDQASGGPTRGWDIVLAADGSATFHTWNNGGVQLTMDYGILGNNQWVTLGGIIGASASAIYLNGVEVDTAAGNNFGTGVIADLQLMTRSGGINNPTNGSMQHLAIGNNASWSQSQLASFFLT